MAKKSPLRGTGRNVGNTDSVPDRDAPKSTFRATDLQGARSFFRYYLLNIAGEAETTTPLPNSLVALRGAGCLPVSMPQSAWPALHLQVL